MKSKRTLTLVILLFSLSLSMLFFFSSFTSTTQNPSGCSSEKKSQQVRKRPQIPCKKPLIMPDGTRPLRLIELLDIALTNSPLTMEAWANAKSAATLIGQEEASYWPFLIGTLFAEPSGDSGFSGIGKFYQTEYGGTIAINWIIFDFGTIDAQVERAVNTFKAAHWTYDWTIQTVLLSVFQNYFDYLASQALYAAQLTNLQEALINERAAVATHEAGVNTIVDVLQAKAFRINVQMNVQNQYSAMKIAHANLATVMGMTPDVCFTVESLPSHFKVEKINRAVEELMKVARCSRADLAAQRATVRAFRANLQAQKAAFWPNFSINGSYTKAYVYGETNDDSYDIALNMNVPLFSGFSQMELIRQAKADLISQQAQLRQDELQAFLDVYIAYYNIKNAGVNLVFSKESFIYSKAAYDAMLAGYRHGTQTFTDLQVALVNLQNSRSTRIQAQTSWFISLAQLGYSIGSLALPSKPNSCKG